MKMTTVLGMCLLALLLVAPALAAESQVINMKTNDFFIVQFEVQNLNNADVRNCVPVVHTSDLPLRDAVTFNPEIFDLPYGASRTVSMRLDDVPVGYYEGELNVKCELYQDGELVNVDDILPRNDAPYYEILVSPAGEGQDYVFIPVQSYDFIARPGGKEQASFTIANTGERSLDVDIVPEAAYQEIIVVEPRKASIGAGDRERFTITVAVPDDFEGFETNLSIKVGDYQEYFPVRGQLEGFTLAGNAVAQNLFQGSVSAGNVQIPVWLVVFIILGGAGYLYRDELFTKKRGKRK
jgi:hypothetical protein